MGEKAPTGPLLAAVDAVKFGFGYLLISGLFFEILANTMSNL